MEKSPSTESLQANVWKRPGSAEPAGGYPRFQYLVNQYRSDSQYEGQSELIPVFSGDAFNPSLESSVTKGKHMLPILNQLPTKMACVGVRLFGLDIRLLLKIFLYRTMTSISESPNS